MHDSILGDIGIEMAFSKLFSFFNFIFIIIIVNGSIGMNRMTKSLILRYSVIFNILNELSIPHVLIDIICQFDRATHFELHDRVMDRLEGSSSSSSISSLSFLSFSPSSSMTISDYDEEEEMDSGIHNLDFYNHDLPIRIYNIILKSEIPFNDSFWYQLIRLFFKWAIHMKQESFNNDYEIDQRRDNQIENFLKSKKKTLHSIISILNEKTRKFLANDFFELKFIKKSLFSNFIIRELMDCEIAENPNLIHLFYSVIFDFYTGSIDCESLKSKYFGGNFDKDPILKAMIYFHDPFDEIKKCFPFDSIHSSNISSHSSTEMNSINFDYLTMIEFLDCHLLNLEIHCMDYLTGSIIEFFLIWKRRFRIYFSFDLLILLRRLEESNLLRGDVIKKIIEFRIDPDTREWGWKKSIFLDYLKMERGFLSLEKYQEYKRIISE